MDFKYKVAVVTGASKGIGKAIALKLASQGANVVLAARNETELNQAANEVSKFGANTLTVPTDVRSVASVRNLAEKTLQKFQAVHFLINNAGIGRFANVTDMTDEDFHATIETNLYGVFYCTRAFLPRMIEQQQGYVVNISSLAGKNSFAQGSAYCASKHALNSFAECLMLEVRHHNIKVTTICPGSVQTDFSIESAEKSWALTSNDVADAVFDVLNTSAGSLQSLIEMRPLKPKRG